MSRIRITIYAIYGIVGFLVGFSFILPNTYTVYRDTLIDAQADKIHHYVGDLDQWPNWTTWKKHDPSLAINVLKPKGKGANQRWLGASGTGSLTFIREETWYGVDYDLIIDNNPPSRASILYSLKDEKTHVEWTMKGVVDIPVAGPYMAMVMDGMLGNMLAENLESLKLVVEQNN